MEIKKVTIKNDKVTIEYRKPNKSDGDVMDELKLVSQDKPEGGFTKALQSLAVDVVSICEFAGEEDAAKYTVTGLSLSTSKGFMGCIITAYKKCEESAGVLVVNTPLKYADVEAAKGFKQETTDKIMKVVEHAKGYLGGSRAQLELFEDQETE